MTNAEAITALRLTLARAMHNDSQAIMVDAREIERAVNAYDAAQARVRELERQRVQLEYELRSLADKVRGTGVSGERLREALDMADDLLASLPPWQPAAAEAAGKSRLTPEQIEQASARKTLARLPVINDAIISDVVVSLDEAAREEGR